MALKKEVFTESFYSPIGEVAEVTITVDFSKKVTDYYLHIEVPFLHAKGSSKSHRELGRGFPYNMIDTWMTKESGKAKGKTYCQWLGDLVDHGKLTPTDMERNGGITGHKANLRRVYRPLNLK